MTFLALSPRSRRQIGKDLQGIMYASPFLLGFVAWRVYPMAYSVWLTFQKWDLLTPARYVGLQNYATMIADSKVWLSLANTAYYTFLGVPLHLALALLLALVLNMDLRGKSVYRTVFYLPSVTPAVASAVIWMQIFHTEFGILNSFLANFGILPIKWLWDPDIAKPALILMSMWGIGPQMVIFLAGLQGIPDVLYEAAKIDGAGRWKQFLNVTVPMLSPVVFFNLVMGVIGSFQVFTAAFIMTSGGPQNATLFAVLYIYRNAFEYFKMGYASLLAWILCIVILFFTFIQFKLGKSWVYYEVS
jgi:multiple sugar transport system permease protein